MIRLIIKRIWGFMLVSLAGITLIFFVIHLSPGDPSQLFINPTSGADIQTQLAQRYGLDKPLIIQYMNWIYRAVFHLDFGISFNTGEDAMSMVFRTLKPTVLISVLSMLVAILAGLPTGIIAGIKRNRKTDRLLTTVMVIFFAMPPIWIGSMLLYLFSLKTGWLPSSHMASLFHEHMTGLAKIQDSISHLILPVLSVSMPLSSYFFRYVRSEIVDVLNSDHFLAARARGISRKKLYFVYITKNILLPVFTIIGTTLPLLFSGSVVVETIYSLPGVGRLIVHSALSRDYPVILASGFMAFLFVVIGSMLADIGYHLVDPRVTEEKT